MNKLKLRLTLDDLAHAVLAVVIVLLTTGLMWLIGVNTLGDAVIALIYLLPVGLVAARWGQIPGISAAVAAALSFDFFFIPPYYTFSVGRLEGWLVLMIFLIVSIIIVRVFQTLLTQAQTNEREAIFMYEMMASISDLRTREAIARTIATQMQQVYQASLVQVAINGKDSLPPFSFSAPVDRIIEGRPDRVLPISADKEVEGEISIWEGSLPLPAEDNRLLQSFSRQAAMALERATMKERPLNSSSLQKESIN